MINIIRIKCYGPVNDPSSPIDGQYLASFDIEAFGGRGTAAFTDNPDNALGFLTMQDAMEVWYGQSRTLPTRSDGKPNRPLTAFTAEFVSEAVSP